MPSKFATELAEKLSDCVRMGSEPHCIAGSIEFPELDKDAAATLIDRELGQVVSAFENLVDCCPCQNGCRPGDMTCATERAKETLRRLEK